VTDKPEARIDSGPIAFGGDWPGLFLRGDDASYYGYQLSIALAAAEEIIAEDSDAVDPEVLLAVMVLKNLVTLLSSVNVSDPHHRAEQLRPARECRESPPTMRGPVPEESPDAKIEIETLRAYARDAVELRKRRPDETIEQWAHRLVTEAFREGKF
jgi:hypothetical protein